MQGRESIVCWHLFSNPTKDPDLGSGYLSYFLKAGFLTVESAKVKWFGTIWVLGSPGSSVVTCCYQAPLAFSSLGTKPQTLAGWVPFKRRSPSGWNARLGENMLETMIFWDELCVTFALWAS